MLGNLSSRNISSPSATTGAPTTSPPSPLDEDIPSSTTHSPIEKVAVQNKSNEVRIGPMTRSRTKLLEQQVNSLLLDYDVSDYESFILPKSMYVFSGLLITQMLLEEIINTWMES